MSEFAYSVIPHFASMSTTVAARIEYLRVVKQNPKASVMQSLLRKSGRQLIFASGGNARCWRCKQCVTSGTMKKWLKGDGQKCKPVVRTTYGVDMVRVAANARNNVPGLGRAPEIGC